MRKVFSICILLSLFVLVNAQSPIGKGQKQLNFGLGFSGWGVPVYVGMDFGVHPDISLGGELSFRSYSDDYYGSSYHHTIVGFDFNGNYHFNRVLEIPRNWDLYAGLNLGFYFWSSSSNYHGSGTSGLGLGVQLGGRYYFNDKWAINLEFGGGEVSGGKIGLTCKL